MFKTNGLIDKRPPSNWNLVPEILFLFLFLPLPSPTLWQCACPRPSVCNVSSAVIFEFSSLIPHSFLPLLLLLLLRLLLRRPLHVQFLSAFLAICLVEVMTRNSTAHDPERVLRPMEVDEQTALLPTGPSHDYNGIATGDEASDDGGEIDPNEFDVLLSRSESISTGIGIEPESQETAMLRGPRRYSHTVKERRSSRVSHRRKSITSNLGSDQGTIEQGTEDSDNEATSKSPFLGGVGVVRFWIIFSGVLLNYFVACFDSTIMVSSHPVITSYFHSASSASWLSTAFLLTSTSFQPLFGRLSDTVVRLILILRCYCWLK
jgi:hypothetical protein